MKSARLEYELLLEGIGIDQLSSYTDAELDTEMILLMMMGLFQTKGYELKKIPIFDWGDLQRDQAQSELMQNSKGTKHFLAATFIFGNYRGTDSIRCSKTLQ